MGEKENKPLQLNFNGLLRVDFRGSRVTGLACWWPMTIRRFLSTSRMLEPQFERARALSSRAAGRILSLTLTKRPGHHEIFRGETQ